MTYQQFRFKYNKEKATGLLDISYNKFTGNWDSDKRKYIKMIKKESMLFGNSKLGICAACGDIITIDNMGGPINYGQKLCLECYDDYYHEPWED